MRRKVFLHGPFAAYHDGPIEVEADSVWEAVEAVVMQVQGFQPHPVTGRQRIQVAGCHTLEKLKRFDTETVNIHITPVLSFGKEQGLFQTIIGVTLIVAGMMLQGLPVIGNLLGNALIMTGISMVVGGVMQMLSPQPQLNSGNEDQLRSKYLASGQNTVAIGTPIPLLYGKFRVGGHIMSLNIDATDTGI